MRVPGRVLVVLSLLLSVPSAATVMMALSTEELVRQSDVVGIAEVRSIAVERHGGTLVTKAVVELSRVLKGAEAGESLTVLIPGGELGEYGQRVVGAPVLAEGETCVVFLERTGPVFRFVGMEQGKLEIEPDPTVDGGWIVRRTADARLMEWLNGELVEVPDRPLTEPLMPYLRELEQMVPQQ